MKRTATALALILATPAAAQSLQSQVEAKLAEAVPGTRFGFVVLDDQGREIVAVNPDGRFIPASNTKMYTTAAAFRVLPNIDQPDTTGGAAVRLSGRDVVLVGNGDARLSSAKDCSVDCLAALADAVAAKTRLVGDVIGDDTLFPDQRWSPGMSWNNTASRYGTGISALTIDDNELALTVTPGKPGEAPVIGSLGYYTVDNRAVTVASGKTDIGFERAPNDNVLRITGTIVAGGSPAELHVGIDDPAHYAAWRMKALLEARGVRVTGKVAARHRPITPNDDPDIRKGAPAARPPVEPVLAKLTPPPLAEDAVVTNKVSQNLHAELFLRRVGLQNGSGSIGDGQVEVTRMLEAAGVARTAYDFSDGSGMSSYNRTAPRATTKLLTWIGTQPWGAQWKATLPIGGVDGTLSRRFKGTVLEGKVFAKTGSLNATNALSGWFVGKSGKTYTFSLIANDVPADGSATRYMDAALVLVAEAN